MPDEKLKSEKLFGTSGIVLLDTERFSKATRSEHQMKIDVNS